MAEIIGNLKEEWRREVKEDNRRSLEIMKNKLKEAIKIELSQKASPNSPIVEAPDPQVLGARVSAKGSYAKAVANVLPKDPFAAHMTRMGLYIVVEDGTRVCHNSQFPLCR